MVPHRILRRAAQLAAPLMGCALILPLSILMVVGISSCGYSAGLAPTLPDGRQTTTIGIEIFGNESQVPNLERRLHEALSDAARRHTSLELVSPERADLVLRGAIEGFRRGPGARTGQNQVVETRDIVTVAAQLVDRAGDLEVGRTRTEVGFGTAIDVPGREGEARDNALRNAADRVMLTLLAGLHHGVVRPANGGTPTPRR